MNAHSGQPTLDPVSGYGRSDMVTIPASATLREAARTMHREGIGALVIENRTAVWGILTERDIVTALAAEGDPDLDAVVGGMTTSVVTARPDDAVLDVALEMLDDDIRHMPVVDENGRSHGMVSLRDLIRPLILQALTPPLSARSQPLQSETR